MNWLFRMFSTDSGDPMLLDHVPTKAMEDWRDEKIKEAAQRFGKPFLCGPDGVLRERFVGKELAKEVVKPKASVTPIGKRKSKE